RESSVFHFSYARDERRERAHDGYEPRENDGLTTVPLVKALRPPKMLLVQKARALTREHSRAHAKPDEVIDGISQNRSDDEEPHGQTDLERRARRGGKGPSCEKKRISRQKRRHDQAGFTEHDREKQRIQPWT